MALKPSKSCFPQLLEQNFFWGSLIKVTFTLVVIFALFFVKESSSQQLPKAAEPERFDQRFQKPLLPKSTQEPVLPKTREPAPPSDLEKLKFVLTEITVEGSTVYQAADFLPFYEEQLRQEISLAGVYQIAAAITAKYRNDGYILSRALIPPQRIASGKVRIKIVEGFIDTVDIEGEIKGRRSLLEAFGKKISQSRPLRAKDLERYLLLINDLAGVKAKSVLTPSEHAFGASKLTLILEHQSFNGFASMDRRGNKFTGPFQGSVEANVNSLLGLYEQTGFRFITTSQTKELSYIRAHHEQQIGAEGTKAIFSGTIVRTEPGHTLKQFDVDSNTSIISVQLSHPLIRSRGKNLSARLGFTRRDSETMILSQLNSKDRLRILNAGVSYDFVDRFRGVNLVSFDFNQGLNIFNATETGAANLTRARGESDFTKISGSAFRLQPIRPRWTFLTEAAWQYSFSHLLASQEFIVGGPRFGRAYDSSEISGAQGFAGKIELQYAHPIGWKFFKTFQYYAFADYGSIWNKGALAGQDVRETLTSAGFGLRYNLSRQISGYLEAAKPMSRRVDAENNKNLRFFFSIIVRF